jgi:hypothetical protein
MRCLPVALQILTLCCFGCMPWDGQPCTTLFAYGVNVTLTDAETGASITDATLTLTEGTYVEEMQSFATGDYVGAGERPGTYTLEASAPGYETQTVENIVVTADVCHVRGVHLDVRLERTP